MRPSRSKTPACAARKRRRPSCKSTKSSTRQKDDIDNKLEADKKAGNRSGPLTAAQKKELENDATANKMYASAKASQDKDEIDRREYLRKLEDDASQEASVARERVAEIDNELAAETASMSLSAPDRTGRTVCRAETDPSAPGEGLERHAGTAGGAQKAADAVDGLQADTVKNQRRRDAEDDRLRFLHLQADAGSHEAAVAAKRLEIQREYNEEEQRLTEIKTDQTKTDARRARPSMRCPSWIRAKTRRCSRHRV